jgi:hypothetical protein
MEVLGSPWNSPNDLMFQRDWIVAQQPELPDSYQLTQTAFQTTTFAQALTWATLSLLVSSLSDALLLVGQLWIDRPFGLWSLVIPSRYLKPQKQRTIVKINKLTLSRQLLQIKHINKRLRE